LWQVDVALVPANSFDGYLFTCSYDIVFVLIVLAARSLSLSLWFNRDGLPFRRLPLFGQPIMEVPLIEDWDQLYLWLGLDNGRKEHGVQPLRIDLPVDRHPSSRVGT
jgi:hypothetical protein